MQTFLPYADFKQSAESLDRQRLGKQRVETFQIIQSLTVEKYGWKHHPAVKMWGGFVPALALYGVEICKAWRARGYLDGMLERIEPYLEADLKMPWWLGHEPFHAAHRSRLLTALPAWYDKFNWAEEKGRGYLWPQQPGEFWHAKGDVWWTPPASVVEGGAT